MSQFSCLDLVASYVLPRFGVPNLAFHGHMKPEHNRVATVKKSQSAHTISSH